MNENVKKTILKAENEMMNKLRENGYIVHDLAFTREVKQIGKYSSDCIIEGFIKPFDLKKGGCEVSTSSLTTLLKVVGDKWSFLRYTHENGRVTSVEDSTRMLKVKAWYRLFDTLVEKRFTEKSYFLPDLFSEFDRNVFDLAINGDRNVIQYDTDKQFLVSTHKGWFILTKQQLFKSIKVYPKGRPVADRYIQPVEIFHTKKEVGKKAKKLTLQFKINEKKLVEIAIQEKCQKLDIR